MPTSDTKLTSLIINKLTRTQYDTSTKETNQLYVCTDTKQLFLGPVEISGGMALQAGQSGKFLTTDGSNTSWSDVDALPSQEGQEGKILGTDGENASWIGLTACYVVVQSKKATSSDKTWYRKYNDGWVEQGGEITLTNAAQQIDLPVRMGDNYYSVSSELLGADSTSNLGVTSRGAFHIDVNPNTAGTYLWEVKGYAAQ